MIWYRLMINKLKFLLTLLVQMKNIKDRLAKVKVGHRLDFFKMTYVVTEKCVDCKFTSCVSVCPVDAFHELPDRLYINPETCIDCNACMDECPVEAIYPDMDVPEDLQEWIELNEEADEFPLLVGQIDALKGPKCTDPNADL